MRQRGIERQRDRETERDCETAVWRRGLAHMRRQTGRDRQMERHASRGRHKAGRGRKDPRVLHGLGTVLHGLGMILHGFLDFDTGLIILQGLRAK